MLPLLAWPMQQGWCQCLGGPWHTGLLEPMSKRSLVPYIQTVVPLAGAQMQHSNASWHCWRSTCVVNLAALLKLPRRRRLVGLKILPACRTIQLSYLWACVRSHCCLCTASHHAQAQMQAEGFSRLLPTRSQLCNVCRPKGLLFRLFLSKLLSMRAFH